MFNFLSLVILVSAIPASGQSFDRPVTEIRTDGEGVYYAHFMYWFTTQTPFLASVEFAILGEVVSVDTLGNEPVNPDCRTRLEVLEILVCPDPLTSAASGVRYLETGDCGGIAAGDSVLVFMTRYEGAFAIPYWRRTNTPIGHKLDPEPVNPYCDGRRLADLIRSGHAWDLDSLSSEELRAWSCVDSYGLLEALIRSKEMEEKK